MANISAIEAIQTNIIGVNLGINIAPNTIANKTMNKDGKKNSISAMAFLMLG